MTIVTIRENFKRTEKTNLISGYSWTEHEKTTSYSVIGACGVYSRHTTLLVAEKEQKALQAFYNKFNL